MVFLFLVTGVQTILSLELYLLPVSLESKVFIDFFLLRIDKDFVSVLSRKDHVWIVLSWASNRVFLDDTFVLHLL